MSSRGKRGLEKNLGWLKGGVFQSMNEKMGEAELSRQSCKGSSNSRLKRRPFKQPKGGRSAYRKGRKTLKFYLGGAAGGSPSQKKPWILQTEGGSFL